MSLAQATPSPMQDHYNSSQYNSAYTGMPLPIYNNDTDYDVMFAQADQAILLKKREQNADISISMTHAGDDSAQVPRKKHKIRIGEKYSDEEESLNNDQSRQFQEYMEKKYETQEMQSNYGKQYMKQMSQQANERKNNKLQNQNKKDVKEDPQVLQIQKQLQKRKQ